MRKKYRVDRWDIVKNGIARVAVFFWFFVFLNVCFWKCVEMDRNNDTIRVWLVSKCSQKEGASEYAKKSQGLYVKFRENIDFA
jgi:hypothetical protein